MIYQTAVPNGSRIEGRNEYYDRFLKGNMERDDVVVGDLYRVEDKMIDRVLAHGLIEVNRETWGGRTGLFLACQGGHVDAVDKLLAHPDIDINKARTRDGATALLAASNEGHSEIVGRLLAHPDIDVNKAMTSNGATALFMASQNGHTEIVDRLLVHPDIDVNKALTSDGTNDGATALFIASHEGHTEIVERLLAHPDIDVNKALTSDGPSDGATALMIASHESYNEIVERLLAHPDIDVKKKANCGRTALDVAATLGVVVMLKAHEKSRKKKKKKVHRECVHCKKSFVDKLKSCELCRCRCCADCHIYHLACSCSGMADVSNATRDAVARRLNKRNMRGLAENID